MLVQVFLGTLDLLAVGLVGLLGTLGVAGVQSQQIGTGSTIARLLTALHMDGLTAQAQVVTLAIVTCVLFLGRTAASIYLTRRALHFLGVRAAEASANLVDRLLEKPITYLQTRTMQEFIFGVTSSVHQLVLGALGTLVVMAADAAMLVAMAVMLLYVSPVVAIAAGVMLGLLVLALHRLTTGRAQDLGRRGAELDVQGRDLLVEAMSTYRDMQVRGSRAFYSAAIRDIRMRSSFVAAESTFLPNISKYVLESAVILGALVVGGLEFALEDAQKAVGVLALFLAAGTRLAPAIIRLQQGATAFRTSAGMAGPALAISKELADTEPIGRPDLHFNSQHSGFQPTVQFDGVGFTYPGAARPALSQMSLRVEAGQLVAFVGSSGAGKSTAADLLLGVLTPDSGHILLGGRAPKDAVTAWPGAIGYVPQDVWIADGSVRKNVTLGLPADAVSDEAIWEALGRAQLGEVVVALPHGLETAVGERGARLSGGQRQRLGIARALLTQPSLIVLDEATSALDAETEHEVASAMQHLRGSTTLVVIAHRLAVVRDADLVVFFDRGQVRAAGSFQQVRSVVPDFDRQARLLGL